MEEVIKFLNENRIGYFSSVDNGKPRVRPWGFMMEDGGKFYFATNNTKDVFKQLKNVPFMEFSSSSKDGMTWVRLSGGVTFVSDKSVKKKILDANPMLKGMYKSEDDPIFEVFYVEHGEASISSFTGAPSKFTF